MPFVTIRPMKAEDIDEIAEWLVDLPLWRRYMASAGWARESLTDALAASDFLLVADCDDQARCGIAWAAPTDGFGRSAYLHLIAVREGHAGQGIGARLIDGIEALAATVGDDLFLLTSDFNHDAQRFYRRQGYEQVGAIPGYVLREVTELIFRKRVRP